LTDDDGGLVRTPTYHVFAMNKGHQDARLLPLHVVEQPAARVVGDASLPLLSASASARETTALISLSNLDLDVDLEITLDLRGRAVEQLTGRLLTAETPQQHNTATEPDAVAPTDLPLSRADDTGWVTVTLPRHSFATVEVALRP
jgi:alpha-N-arabinofuranosidase